jgi:hypothetical protein
MVPFLANYFVIRDTRYAKRDRASALTPIGNWSGSDIPDERVSGKSGRQSPDFVVPFFSNKFVIPRNEGSDRNGSSLRETRGISGQIPRKLGMTKKGATKGQIRDRRSEIRHQLSATLWKTCQASIGNSFNLINLGASNLASLNVSSNTGYTSALRACACAQETDFATRLLRKR